MILRPSPRISIIFSYQYEIESKMYIYYLGNKIKGV